MKQKSLLIIGAIAVLVIGLVTVFYVMGNPLSNNQAEGSSDAPTNYSMDIVFDGDHHKIDHEAFNEENNLYISLPDLKSILDLDVKQNGGELKILYQDNSLTFLDQTIQNSNAKESDVAEYLVKNDIIYLSDNHIEKFLGVSVDYFYDQRTKTISLLSPQEQQKENYDKEVGSTIFLHKEDVPLAKYEPRGGLYLGGYVVQDEFINFSMNTFNELTGREHASYFRYVGYGKPFPTEWVNDVKSTGGFPQIAWEPNNGLEEVVDDEYLRQFARDAKAAGVPVLMRWASEMNGTWTAYSGDPELYIEKWKLVHDIMEEEAPNVMMLWNVFTMPEQTIDDFYPGDEYVDYVGVNIYNVVYHNDRLEDNSEFEDPLRLLDYVYNEYSDTKPIVIGEFGATNYNVTDGLYHVDFAEEKISRLYKYLPELYPRVKFVYYFDVNNLVNAPEGRKINNYAITENERVKSAYADHVQNPAYLSTVQENPSSGETFSYRDFMFYHNDDLYVDIQFVQEYLNMDVEEAAEDSYKITFDGNSSTFDKKMLSIDKAAFFEKRDINGVAINEVLKNFNIDYEYVDGDLHIYE